MLSERQILSLKLTCPGTSLLAFVCCPALITVYSRLPGSVEGFFFLFNCFPSLSPFLPPLPAPHSHLLGKGSSGLGFGEARRARLGRLLVLDVKLPVFKTPAALGVTHDHGAVAQGCKPTRWSSGVSSILELFKS